MNHIKAAALWGYLQQPENKAKSNAETCIHKYEYFMDTKTIDSYYDFIEISNYRKCKYCGHKIDDGSYTVQAEAAPWMPIEDE